MKILQVLPNLNAGGVERTAIEIAQALTAAGHSAHIASQGGRLSGEAQTAGAILGHNYQNTEWYEDSYALLTGQGLKPKAKRDGWLGQIYRQTVKGEWL